MRKRSIKSNTKKDSREKLWKKQRKERGFDDRELWSLDYTIALFVLPRLKAFKENKIGYPSELTEKEWKDILAQIIEGFELIADHPWILDEKEYKKVYKSLKLFAKWFLNLWY